jgi:hypothetical protein
VPVAQREAGLAGVRGVAMAVLGFTTRASGAIHEQCADVPDSAFLSRSRSAEARGVADPCGNTIDPQRERHEDAG